MSRKWHSRFGGTLPTAEGEVIAQGEDLGGWVGAQLLGWGDLLPAQQWPLGGHSRHRADVPGRADTLTEQRRADLNQLGVR